MTLLTEELRRMLPPLGATDTDEDPMVLCKFFTPAPIWIWYVLEFDGQDLFYAFVDGLDLDFGYFNLSELDAMGEVVGLPVERDQDFEPCKLSQVLQAYHVA